VSITTSNMIQYMLQKPELIQKMREEFKQAIAIPFKQNNPEKTCNLENMLNSENIYDMKYYISCFNESLRLEPPV